MKHKLEMYVKNHKEKKFPLKESYMKFIKLAMIISLLAFVLVGCGSNPEPKAPAGMKEVFQPDWYDVEGDEENIFVYGTATKITQNASYNSAYVMAQQKAANYVQVHVKGMIKDFMEEAGVDNPQVTALTSNVVKVVSNAEFRGSKVVKKQVFTNEQGRYVTFVRLAVPRDEVDRKMMNQIKQEEALYNQFKASQGFNELDEELNK